jgi:hypothetical protein
MDLPDSIHQSPTQLILDRKAWIHVHFADGNDELRWLTSGGWYHNGLETRMFSDTPPCQRIVFHSSEVPPLDFMKLTTEANSTIVITSATKAESCGVSHTDHVGNTQRTGE